MKVTPERIEKYYTVRCLCPISKKWYRTRWKMTREDAAKRYTPGEYEIIENTEEEWKVGGDPLENSLGRFYVGFDESNQNNKSV